MPSNVHINSSVWSFKESRCSFEELKDNDLNPKNNKVGIRCHNAITAFFLRIFGKIETIRTGDGKTVYLNKNSFEKWKNWRASQMTSPPESLSVDDIIKHVADAKTQAAEDAKKKAAEDAETTKKAEEKAAKEKNISTRRAEIQSLEDEKSQKEREISETKEKKETEEKNLTALQQAQTKNEDGLKATLSALEDDLSIDAASLESIKKEHASAAKALTEAKNAFIDKESSLKQAESSLKQVTTDKQNLEQQKPKLEKEKADKQGLVKSKKEEIAKMPFQLTKTDPRKTQLKKEVTKLREEIKNLQDRIKTLEGEIEVKSNRKDLLKQAQEKCNDEVIRQQLTFEDCEKKEAQLKKEMNTLLKNNQGLEETIRMKTEQKDTELTEFNKNIQEKQTQIEQLSTKISETEESLSKLESELAEANTHLKELLPSEETEDPEVAESEDSEVDDPEGSVSDSGDGSDITNTTDADPMPSTEKLSEAQSTIIAKNKEHVDKVLADITAKVNKDVADIIQTLTDRFQDDPSLTAEWVCTDKSKDEYTLKLNKPLRLWIRPSLDNKPDVYDTQTPRGVVLLIGENNNFEFKMRLKKNEIAFTSGFNMRCEFHATIAFIPINGKSSGEFTKLSYNTAKHVVSTSVNAKTDSGIKKTKKEDRLKETIIRDWKNGIVIPDDQTYEEFLHSQTETVDGKLPATPHS